MGLQFMVYCVWYICFSHMSAMPHCLSVKLELPYTEPTTYIWKSVLISRWTLQLVTLIVTEFEKTWLPHTDVHFSPSHNSCTYQITFQIGISAEICCDCFCCGLCLYQFCQMSINACLIFKGLYLSWRSSKLAINLCTTGWRGWAWI